MSKDNYQFHPHSQSAEVVKENTLSEITHAMETPTEKPTEPQAEVTIRLPSRWTVHAYEMYVDAKQQYAKRCAAEAPPRMGAEWVAMFHGALALIKADIVHVDGLDVLMRAVAEQGIADMAIIGFIARSIGNPVESSVIAPLPAWIVK